ncbi:MAG TPA: histidine phosphatase family protein, partial [Gemmatimonadaceae bacterium]|nr:histidine phosphatase family protein [Gemmatimonadaceae bacterium]
MRLLLVRHATCDPVGRVLAGRAPGVRLNAEGRTQATALARHLRELPIAAVYSSPLERAVETAQVIAAANDTVVHIEPGLIELDFGR